MARLLLSRGASHEVVVEAVGISNLNVVVQYWLDQVA